jgi:hypothetical protein
MKFQETHFEEYIQSVKKNNLHPKLEELYNLFPTNLDKIGNLIFYGPSGVGKYSQVLNFIRRFSQTELKYEKKLNVIYDKKQYYLKISDIHYEVDMSLLGCNSKLLWHEIYQQIVDAIIAKPNKYGIILCKNFQDIHNELLENFYSYMQDNNSNSSLLQIKYVILTEQISFIPKSILNCCEIIHIERPKKNNYNIFLKNNKLSSKNTLNISDINNIKALDINIDELYIPHHVLCNKIINEIDNIDDIRFQNFRDILYDLLIYNLDIYESIWYILNHYIQNNKIKRENISYILLKIFEFFRYYNNNYRPIYHLENFFFNLVRVINEY